MSILEKWSNKSKGLTKSVEDQVDSNDNYMIRPSAVMMNDGVNICATACASCWDTKIPDGYLDRAVYVGKRTKIGHTSVIEHSNIVMYMYIPKDFTEDLLEFVANVKYLNKVIRSSHIKDGWHMLLGGSWRGYADLFLRTTTISTNKVMMAVTNFVYENIPSAALMDIIGIGVIDESAFTNMDSGVPDSIKYYYNQVYNHRIDDNINIVSCDSISKMIDRIKEHCFEPEIFSYKDLLELLSVTIEFNGMSRIITQQLTRHRNGITQESQRYVDYSKAPFNSPATFKPDKYNDKKLYEISFGGQRFKMNLQNIGNAINGIYPQLKDKTKLGKDALTSEDARAYLASNTQCGKLYMTFTYYSLIKFLQLREDPHAQVEIREFAIRIGKWFREEVINPFFNEELNIYDALISNMINNSIFTNSIIKESETGEEVFEETLSAEEYEKIYAASIEKEDSLENEEVNE